MCRCLDRLTTCLLRLINLVLLLIGLAGVGYAIYLTTAPLLEHAPLTTTTTTSPLPPTNVTTPVPTNLTTPTLFTTAAAAVQSTTLPVAFPASVGGMGALLALLSLFMMTCGHRSVCYISLYCFTLALVVVAQIALAIMFLLKKGDDVIQDLNLNESQAAFVNHNIHIIAYGFIGVGSLEVVSIILSWCHRGVLIDAQDDEFETPSGRSLLGGRRKKSGKVELGSQAEKRRDNYRNKYAHLYDKYQISTTDEPSSP